MFQCIIQQRTGWIHAPSPDMRDVFPDIRLQLNEQLRCLDVRMESQVSLIQELQDFFRKRAELEIDYSKSLDKLAKTLQLRHKEQKQKREQWPLFSSYACWQQLVNQTKSLSKDHAVLSEIYSVHLVARLQTVIEDVQRIYRRCREICYETHEEILRVLHELHTTTKTYQNYQAECKAAEVKLRTAESQRLKLQNSIPKDKLERSKKYRLTEKEVLKRKSKYTDARLKALKAKTEYQLCLEASNTTIHKYFVEDLSDLIDCMDLGFCSMFSRAILMHVTADQGRCRAVQQNSENLSHTIQTMDSRADKQKFLEQHSTAFMIPKRIEFQGPQAEDLIEPEVQKALHQEMEQRLQLLGVRLNNLRAESDEIWKTLETAEKNLLEHLCSKDYDTSGQFGDGSFIQAKPIELLDMTKSKADKQEIEDFYLLKIREYILGTSKIARLDAKADLIRTALEKDAAISCGPVIKSNIPKRKRIGRMNTSGQPKLFGGSLEEYLEATAEEIPLIMRSCIRVINLYGLHHQGIFRVSGSQVEISNFREGFERGEDPLADTNDASDINSVAGVLKLYLRELREPLFPIFYFEQFISLAKLESKREIVIGIKTFLQRLPRSVLIVLRYLFAFLNHLSEYADENMMDAYNLAICFGPTLMPAPEDKDQVQYQNQINEIIKNMIQYHEELFLSDLGGIQYEKYISDLDIDVGDSPSEQLAEDADSEVYPSEDESDTVEAIAQFDFNARSDRELSLRKGDTVVLRKQVSTDWWQGTISGKEGLVPDKYISLKIKDEDRDKNSEHMKSTGSGESFRKRRPSYNMSLNSQLSIFGPSQGNADEQGSSCQQQFAQVQQIGQQTFPINLGSTDPQLQREHIHQLLGEKIDAIALNKQMSGSGDVDGHNDTVDSIKNKYEFHEQPHSFEKAMDFLEEANNPPYEPKKPSEPIYAEPMKQPQVHSTGHFDECEGVVLRGDLTGTQRINIDNNRRSENLKIDKAEDGTSTGDTNRHSDGDLFRDGGSGGDLSTAADNHNSMRKYYSKSLSLSEKRIELNSNLFHQNRELWEKRGAESNIQQNITQPSILERKRMAPDLVMDLPLSMNKDDSLRSSRDSLDTGLMSSEEMTSAECFASQNQCTLKKNERFSSSETFLDKKEVKLDTHCVEKPKAEVKPQEIKRESTEETKAGDVKGLLDEVLHIEEGLTKDHLQTTPIAKERNTSPIPARNTQKYVTQFADMKLTGGCLSQPDTKAATDFQVATTSGQVQMKSLDSTPQLSSFKPQVRVKPHILKKPFVRPPTTPEMQRKGGDNSSNISQD